MVRTLLHAYPMATAVVRSTIDADTVLDSLEVVSPLTANLIEENSAKRDGNLFYREVALNHKGEVNLLAPRTGPARGIRPDPKRLREWGRLIHRLN